MKKYLALIVLLVTSLTGCGFHLQHETEVPAQFKTMSYVSGDPYGQLSRNIKELLVDNKVTLVDGGTSNYPTLRIISSRINKDTISIYRDGKAAEYQMVLNVEAQVIIANEQIYPITVSIFRSFFDNPAVALAKTAEQTMIEQEMYKQAARQIIGKLKSINTAN